MQKSRFLIAIISQLEKSGLCLKTSHSKAVLPSCRRSNFGKLIHLKSKKANYFYKQLAFFLFGGPERFTPNFPKKYRIYSHFLIPVRKVALKAAYFTTPCSNEVKLARQQFRQPTLLFQQSAPPAVGFGAQGSCSSIKRRADHEGRP